MALNFYTETVTFDSNTHSLSVSHSFENTVSLADVCLKGIDFHYGGDEAKIYQETVTLGGVTYSGNTVSFTVTAQIGLGDSGTNMEGSVTVLIIAETD